MGRVALLRKEYGQMIHEISSLLPYTMDGSVYQYHVDSSVIDYFDGCIIGCGWLK